MSTLRIFTKRSFTFFLKDLISKIKSCVTLSKLAKFVSTILIFKELSFDDIKNQVLRKTFKNTFGIG